MTTALLYRSRQKWQAGVAFSAAVLIHCAVLALGNVHRVEKPDGPNLMGPSTEITFEDAPPTLADPEPDVPAPLSPPLQTDNTFPEDHPTPPPARKQTRQAAVPLVRSTNNRTAGPATWSSARVLALSAPKPEYPYEARRQKITGDGAVTMIIDPLTGNVTHVSMAKSTGSPFLDNAALTGFQRWRFKPGTVSSVTCPVTFTLAGLSY
jgi:protein TonB